MEDTFKIRAYGYCELAQLYFPNVTKKSASVQFRRWIVLNEDLKEKLRLASFKPGQRILTPKQVGLITDALGLP